ncbi:hypothetical protein SNE40_020594 [Patella caerulea]|uniref:Globin n=1 Tax=Patella caerulea TaxID=87958 RepID=A0AAN8J4R1_PATCE
MGCDSSKQSLPTYPPEQQEEGGPGFTETQIDTIRSTWPLLSRDMLRVGTEVFIRIFTELPSIKELFTSFQIQDVNDLHQQPTFRRHAGIFMQVIQLVVDNLESSYNGLHQEIMVLGARHVTFRGFKVEYFSFYVKCLIQVWELELGEEFILEVRDCWKILFDYLVVHMTEGYELALKDSTVKSSTQNGNGVKRLTIEDKSQNGAKTSQNGNSTSQNKPKTSQITAKNNCILEKRDSSLCEVRITT